ncbi:hypothetical protein [Paracoccus sp. (in: a-proteobacteria)]|uniref:hypothetical protein n=1 Tax=Paracoccus sp. TaxID=267 RepID=UPI0035B4EFC6
MPAAKPSQATINNAVRAILAAGLTPGALLIGADGSVRVEILQHDQSLAENRTSGDDAPKGGEEANVAAPRKWGEKKAKQ